MSTFLFAVFFISILAIILIVIVSFLDEVGLAVPIWGFIRGHKLIYLSSNSNLSLSYAFRDVWGRLRSPGIKFNEGELLTLKEDGKIQGFTSFYEWKWAKEKG